ncbi:alpha-hydroxy acid oxidase [Sphingobium sp.]|uniref:alpha-hydroxy acid oxidase n=1 Tax=Sphingobium sp. TaxID=1912891 RepID=UPI0028BE9195|nr:alpha-hydroxy acid oxidase [Sphingobium sp.]
MPRSVTEWQAAARAKLDPALWDYLEFTHPHGPTDAAGCWDAIPLYPRILRGATAAGIGATVLGSSVTLPILTAPNGRATRFHPDGELAVLRGARAAGTIAILPSSVAASAATLAAREPQARWWQQLYMLNDRGLMAERLARLRGAGCGAIVLTADLLPDGRAAPPPPPRAVWESGGVEAPACYSGASLDDLEWLVGEAGLPVIVKGVLRPDDAALCVTAGASGVIVSNHGGNQLPTAVASAIALPAIVKACPDADIYVDGGIRSGVSVLKALAMGARAVLVGRPASYALAVAGADGVAAMLARLGDELAHAMQLCGVSDIRDLDGSLLTQA